MTCTLLCYYSYNQQYWQWNLHADICASLRIWTLNIKFAAVSEASGVWRIPKLSWFIVEVMTKIRVKHTVIPMCLVIREQLEIAWWSCPLKHYPNLHDIYIYFLKKNHSLGCLRKKNTSYSHLWLQINSQMSVETALLSSRKDTDRL